MKRWQADLGLVLLTVIWGTTFTVVHQAARVTPALGFIAVRFSVASVVLLPLVVLRRREVRTNLAPGALLGVLLLAGFALQTMGLARTTPSRAGFITGLSVVLVPIIGRFLGQRLTTPVIAGVTLATAGLALVSWGCLLAFLQCATEDPSLPQRQWGDMLVLFCAVVFAIHILAVGHFSRRCPVLTLNAIQIVVVAAGAGLAHLLFEPKAVLTPAVWTAALFLGVVATALALTMWLAFQRFTTATHAALVFSLEPVFAAFFAWLWIGEQITLAVLSGGALILIGVVLAELPGREGSKQVDLPRALSDDPAAR